MVTAHPKTQYARCGKLHVAYQVLGDGPLDLIFVPQWFSHVELIWEEPLLEGFLRRLASFARLIIFDQRGTGLSDPVPVGDMSTLEARMEDITAVLDAAESERTAIMGASYGGPLAALYAATHPDRISSLVLFNTYARMEKAPDYPIGIPVASIDLAETTVSEAWGTETTVGYATVDLSQRTRDWLARYQRTSISPGAAVALLRVTRKVDIRPILPSIRVPTLIMHRHDNPTFSPAHGRYLADHIPGATYAEVPGSDNSWWADDQRPVLDQIQEFLTGDRPAPVEDRVLATVVFTDLVGSTEQASKLGDESWMRLLRDHASTVRGEVDRFRGRYIKSTGDGALATFDGPARAIHCAVAIRDGLRDLGLEVRAGVHTGEIELLDDDIGGIAVHIGSRVSALAMRGEVLVSSTVKDLVVGSGISFEDRGVNQLKGVPGEWRIFAVAS